MLENKTLDEIKEYLTNEQDAPLPWSLLPRERHIGPHIIDANHNCIDADDVWLLMEALEREVVRVSSILWEIEVVVCEGGGELNLFDLERIKEKCSEKAREADTNE